MSQRPTTEVPSAFLSLGNQLGRHLLPVRRLSDQRADVDERRGDVEPPAELAGRVVLREGVVVVVETLARRRHRHQQVLCRVDVLVVRPHAPHVRGAVDEPRDVEGHDVAQDGGDDECVEQTLAPAIIRNDRRKGKTEHEQQRAVEPEYLRLHQLIN